jgi:hypothetical protein
MQVDVRLRREDGRLYHISVRQHAGSDSARVKPHNPCTGVLHLQLKMAIQAETENERNRSNEQHR